MTVHSKVGCPIFTKVARAVLLKSDVFKIAQKVPKYFGRFCEVVCHQGLIKAAQSGHTVGAFEI